MYVEPQSRTGISWGATPSRIRHASSAAPLSARPPSTAPDRLLTHQTLHTTLVSARSVPELYEHALKYEPSTHIVGSGALATLSGAKTGRSPK